MSILSSELRAWVAPGLAGALSTIAPSGQPQIARIWAVRVLAERDVIEVHVLRSASEALLSGLTNGGRAALTLVDVTTYRSRQFKGRCAMATGVDDAFVDRSLAAFNRSVSSVGMPVDCSQSMLGHCADPRSMVALELSVESVFDQSPKPGAGEPL